MLAAVSLVLGCAAKTPVAVEHVVLISLADSNDRPALEADCRRLLTRIPGVQSLTVGPPVDTGRSTVDSDYDTGLLVSFDSRESYASYVTHPNHVALVTQWKARILKMRVFDFGP